MENLIKFDDRIFVAGATGMAGSAIIRNLLKKGYGDKSKGGLLLKPNRKELDLRDITLLRKWLGINKPSIIIIAAAKVGGILANKNQPADFLIENLKIQTNLIESAWTFGVRRLLFLGSSCIYPKYAKQPIKEEYLLTSELEPTNECYALAKISGIKLCESLRIQYGFDAISLMPTNLYGPGDNYHPTNSHVIASLIRKFSDAKKNHLPTVTCWGTGSALREFMHVDDLGEAVVFTLEKWNPNSATAPLNENGKPLTYLNVGTGLDISIKDLSEKIAYLTGFQGKIIWDHNLPDGTPKKQLEIKKILKLGWKPTIDLDKGLAMTISSYKKQYE
tara:strand:+ start:496 stop:1494 length:999 start_codon:yes stop_codon:yes gene_type:complete